LSTSAPAVTVVMPTFNRRQLLPIAVDSVRNQTFSDWELLIVDDHSTDDTRSLVEAWQAEEPRIRYLVNERTKGPAGARNTAIDRARGRYIALLDSDDEWLTQHLERAGDYLERYPDLDIFSAGAERRVRQTGQVYQASRPLVGRRLSGRREQLWIVEPEDSFNRLFDDGILVTQTLVIRASSLGDLRFCEELPPGPEDHYFQLELAASRVRIGVLDEPHVIYWAHGDNLTTCGGGAAPPRKLEKLYKTYQVQYELMLRELPLSPRQRRAVTELQAHEGFWYIGYGGHLQLGEFAQARRWFVKSIRLRPWRVAYWKTFLASYAHQALGHRIRDVTATQ
jgi:glycosyltransferase involved in cell wall biosynthesis